jgi:MFS superfamily sulfate permease-like transporter
MISKPQGDWHQRDEGAAVRTVRTATAAAASTAKVAHRGGAALAGLACFAVAIFWGSLGITSAGSVPEFIGNSAMVAFVAWIGYRLLMKARAISG